MVTIIDYGMGNLNSIGNMIKKIGGTAKITSDIDEIAEAKKLILPGVGAFDNGMQKLDQLGMIPVLNEKVIARKTPILGICLGMQLLTQRSEEGKLPGLGWFEAETKRFNFGKDNDALKIPHMGWNAVVASELSTLFHGFDTPPRFYFVHSYHFSSLKSDYTLATTHHGYDFTSAIHKDHIFGTQFHPEKSHKFGMRLLGNFIERV